MKLENRHEFVIFKYPYRDVSLPMNRVTVMLNGIFFSPWPMFKASGNVALPQKKTHLEASGFEDLKFRNQ